MKPKFNTFEQHTGSLRPEGLVEYPMPQSLGPDPTRSSNLRGRPGEEPEVPVIDPADEPIPMGDPPPVDLEDLRINQDDREV